MNPDLRYSCDYALTVTLKPDTNGTPARYQMRKFAPKLSSALIGTHATVIAELTANKNVHFHVLLKVDLNKLPPKTTPIKHISNLLKEDFGFIKLKQCTDYPGWTTYMQKQMFQTSYYIHPVVQDDYDMLGLPDMLIEYDST